MTLIVCERLLAIAAETPWLVEPANFVLTTFEIGERFAAAHGSV